MMQNNKKNQQCPRVIAISSGKGGTGKTFLAINLASALHQAGQRVYLLDGDFGLANIHLLLGEKPEKDLKDVLQGKCSLDDILLTAQEGFQIIPSSRGCSSFSNLNTQQLSSLISAVDNIDVLPDILLIDTAGTIHSDELQLISTANEVIIVITPHTTSIQDAAEYIRQLHFKYQIEHFFIIANMAKNCRESQSMFEKLQNLVGFDAHVVLTPLGNVSIEENANQSIIYMSSFLEMHPHSKTAQQLLSIANKINKKQLAVNKTGGLSFFYQHQINNEGL